MAILGVPNILLVTFSNNSAQPVCLFIDLWLICRSLDLMFNSLSLANRPNCLRMSIFGGTCDLYFGNVAFRSLIWFDLSRSLSYFSILAESDRYVLSFFPLLLLSLTRLPGLYRRTVGALPLVLRRKHLNENQIEVNFLYYFAITKKLHCHPSFHSIKIFFFFF